MAELPVKKPRIRKAPVTVRERREQFEKTQEAPEKPRRVRRATGKAAAKITAPVKKAHYFGQKEYYLPMPGGKFGKFLNKRRSIIPQYFKDSWAELKLVTWPGRRETWRLTGAVFIFALVFGIIITFVDKGIETLVKDIVLK